MNFFAPPMLDVSNIQTWKFEMSAFIKTLGINIVPQQKS